MNNNQKSFIMVGTISQDDKVSVYESFLGPLNVRFSEDSTDSAYTLAFLDNRGVILDERPFTVSFKTPHLPFPLLNATFSIVHPFPSSTASVEIRRSGKVLLHLQRSHTAPTISNLRVIPSIDYEFNQNISIGWQSSDPDGDELTFSVSYSIDEGKSFLPLEGGLKKSRLTLSTLGLSGNKNALLKVTASDGFNISEAISDHFTISPTAPVSTILSPRTDKENNDFISKMPLFLRGTALDPQDGILDGKSLEWFLVEPDREHLLGTGSEILLKSLPLGKHAIKLTATDRDGKSGTDERVIIVKRHLIDEVSYKEWKTRS